MALIATLTPDERVRIRHHLGFLNVQEAATFALGVPAAVETQFVIEGAFDKLLEAALPLVRRLLAACDSTEAQFFDNQENLAVTKVGGIQLRDDEGNELMGANKRYDYWRRALANAFGIWVNPFDGRPGLGAGSNGINVSVRG